MIEIGEQFVFENDFGEFNNWVWKLFVSQTLNHKKTKFANIKKQIRCTEQR
jgi:hypothetical protein